MLDFSDAPYRFFEARPSPALIWLGRELNRRFILRGPNHRITDIRVEGDARPIREARDRGERLMFVANHATHSDAQVLTEVHRRLGIPSCYMAAYDVFMRGNMNAWCMQRLGNFSIDREGSDRKAMTAAIKTLTDGKRALNIFPEGNVYLTNDRVTPFLDGAAFIALKAQAALKENSVKVIPVSMKFTHLTAPRDTVTERMMKLAEDCGHTFPPGSTMNPVDSVLGLGARIIGKYLEAHGMNGNHVIEEKDLFRVLEDFTGELVVGLEKELGLPAVSSTLVERIVRIRSKIHQLRIEETESRDPRLVALADKAILAFRIHGYLTPYLTDHPTIDRFDETVERIAEDFHSHAMPRTGPRRALVKIHAPIDIRDFSGTRLREALPSLTGQMQEIVQSGIDALNGMNDAPGSELLGKEWRVAARPH